MVTARKVLAFLTLIMNKENTQEFIQDIAKKLMFVNERLDKRDYSSKEHLRHEILNIKEYYDSNVEVFKTSNNPDFLALQTALGNVDCIFDELIEEIENL